MVHNLSNHIREALDGNASTVPTFKYSALNSTDYSIRYGNGAIPTACEGLDCGLTGGVIDAQFEIETCDINVGEVIRVPDGGLPCNGQKLELTGYDNGLLFQWQAALAPTSRFVNINGATQPYYNLPNSGSQFTRYRVMATASDLSCSKLSSVYVAPTVTAATSNGFLTVSKENADRCADGLITLTLSGYTGTPLDWEYSLDGINYSSIPIYSYLASGPASAAIQTRITTSSYFRVKTRNAMNCIIYSNSVMQVASNNYYVNDASTAGDRWCTAAGYIGNDGLSAQFPQSSIQEIISRYVLQACDTVFIDRGDYGEQVIVSGGDAGSASGNLVFIGANVNDTRIFAESPYRDRSPTPAPDYAYNFKIDRASYVKLQSMEFLWDYIRIPNVCCAHPASDFENIVIEANNATVQGCKIQVQDKGIVITGFGTTATSSIRTSTGNKIIQNSFFENAGESGVGVFIDSKTASGLQVINNSIHAYTGIEVAEMMFSNDIPGGISSTDNLIYNNSISGTTCLWFNNRAPRAFKLKNNILSASGDCIQMPYDNTVVNYFNECDYMLYALSGTSSRIARLQNLSAPGTGFVQTNYASLSQWAAFKHSATGNGDEHSYEGNPLFIDEAQGVLTLLGCTPARGRGTQLVAVTNDFNSLARRNPSTIGAYEYPSVSANAGADVTICTGSSTQLTACGGDTYSWSPVAGLSNAAIANPIASPTTTTTYTVTTTDSRTGQTSSDIVVVTVLPGPNTAVVANTTSLCGGGGEANLTASGADTYSWSPSGGLTCTNCYNPIARPATTTTYTVTGTRCGISNSASITITVSPQPTLTVGGPYTICRGSSVQLSAQGSGGTISWTPTSRLTGASTYTPTANPLQSTTYTATVRSAQGCEQRRDVYVEVIYPPSITGQSTPYFYCPGSTGTLLNQLYTNVASYSWSPASGLDNASSGTPRAAPAQTTTYTVTAYSTNPVCSNATKSIQVLVPERPQFDFSYSYPRLSVNFTYNMMNSVQNPSYLWNFDANNSSSSNQTSTVNPTNHVYSVSGTYRVTLRVTSTVNGCAVSNTVSKMVPVDQNYSTCCP